MKTTFKRFAAALGLVLIGTILTAKANAECGYYPPSHKGGAVVSPQSWRGAQFGSASLLFVSDHHSDDDSSWGLESDVHRRLHKLRRDFRERYLNPILPAHVGCGKLLE